MGCDYNYVYFSSDSLCVVETGRSVSFVLDLATFFTGTPLPKATSRNTSISLFRRCDPHRVIDYILRYGIRLGGDVRQN
jgi:hypothetical protein